MKLPDWLIGAVLFALSMAVLWHVRTFPDIPGQQYGAALFPGLAATGLGIASLGLVVTGLLRRRRAAHADGNGDGNGDGDGDGKEDLDPMTARRWLALLLSVGSIVFYIVAAESLGFILTGVVILVAMMWAYGSRPALIVPVAIVATLLVHTGFYKLLRVPLPWGVLQPIAW